MSNETAAPLFDSPQSAPPPPPSTALALPKILGGLLVSSCFCCGVFGTGYMGAGAAGVCGLLSGIGVASLVSGIMNFAGKRSGFGIPAGIAVAVMLLGAIAGPPAGRAARVSTQKSKSEELAGERDAVNLRRHLAEIREEKEKYGLEHDEAIQIAVDGLASAYKDALDQLAKQSGEGADEKLRDAFRKVLEDLAAAETSDVHLAFSNKTVLDAPEGTDEFLTMMYGQLGEADRAKHPDMAKAVIGQGDAFTPAYDKRRRSAFEESFRDAMQAVFKGDLLSLVPLEEGADRKGKLVLEVGSTIRRGPNFYTYTEEEIFSGFLFGFVVEWSFKMFDREGNLLYETTTVSSPAQQLRLESQQGDPSWAPYSVMMDSAYFNYSREVIAMFGLTPPAEKASFKFVR